MNDAAAKLQVPDQSKTSTTPPTSRRAETAPAPLCLTYGYARDGDSCCDCGDDIYPSSFVSVGRLDAGRLCEDCARHTPLGDVAEALDQLDTVVYMAHAGGDVPAVVMALNLQRAVDYMVEHHWLPRYAPELPDGAA